MALAKARDRRVIRTLIRRDHTVGDILHALALNHPRGALPLAVGVEQQREHHPRLVRRTAVAIPAVGVIERRQIHLLDARQHEPRKMILRQPLPQTRRQQQLLITVTSNEALGHTPIVLNPPDSTLYATATTTTGSATSGYIPARSPRPRPSRPVLAFVLSESVRGRGADARFVAQSKSGWATAVAVQARAATASREPSNPLAYLLDERSYCVRGG